MKCENLTWTIRPRDYDVKARSLLHLNIGNESEYKEWHLINRILNLGTVFIDAEAYMGAMLSGHVRKAH